MESIRCVRLVTNEPVDLDRLVTEFPTVTVELASACGVCDAIVDCEGWLVSTSFAPFDRAIAETESVRLSVRGPCKTIAEVACEVLTRYQRHVARRNELSSTPLFDAVLRAHAGLHAETAPTIDAWQWMLRLDAHASFAAQVAALFHDVGGGVHVALRAAGVDDATAALAQSIVLGRAGAEVDLLDDAKALSFFSLGSAGYFDASGREETRREVARALGRMSPRARSKLATARLRPDVQHLLLETDRAA